MTQVANTAVSAPRGTTVALDFTVVDALGSAIDCTDLTVTVGICDSSGRTLYTITVGDSYDVDGRGAIWTDVLVGAGTLIPSESSTTRVAGGWYYQWYITDADGLTLSASDLLRWTVLRSARP